MFRHTQNLCSFYLSFVFKTFVSTLTKKEFFPQDSDLSLFHLIIPPCSISYLRSHLHFQPSSHYCTIMNPYFTVHPAAPHSLTADLQALSLQWLHPYQLHMVHRTYPHCDQTHKICGPLSTAVITIPAHYTTSRPFTRILGQLSATTDMPRM